MPLGGIFGRSRSERSREAELNPPTTPRPSRTRARALLSSPHTPLSKIFTSFGGRGGESWKKSFSRSEGVETVTRPSTASSTYSSSSDSSFESMRTMATECTIPDVYEEDDEDSEDEKEQPKLGPAFSENSSFSLGQPLTTTASSAEKKRKHQEWENNGVRAVDWTDEMDGHLWRTYMLYQSDPTVTPFYVLPGGVPPLGVCHRVARVARGTWKGSKNVRARVPVTQSKGESRLLAGNKADLMRKASAFRWPASESSTRKRLKLLCRRGYGPLNNPYHNHRQNPTQFRTRRPAAQHPSSGFPIIQDNINEDDRSDISFGNTLLTSTRSLALSLATSASVSMRPDGALAAITGGTPLLNLTEREATAQLQNQDSPQGFHDLTDSNGNTPPVAVVLASVGLGRAVYPRPVLPSAQSSLPPLFVRRARANTTNSASLELLAAGISFIPSEMDRAWQHREERPEESSPLLEEFGGPLLRSNTPARQSSEESSEDIAPPPQPQTPPPGPRAPAPRTRQRGYTINVGASNGMNGKRRARPSDISSPLPTWVYDNLEGPSERPNLAQLVGAQPSSAGLLRLGSPFEENQSTKGKWRSVSDNEEFGPPLPKKASVTGVVAGQVTREDAPPSYDEDNGRPMKRMRE